MKEAVAKKNLVKRPRVANRKPRGGSFFPRPTTLSIVVVTLLIVAGIFVGLMPYHPSSMWDGPISEELELEAPSEVSNETVEATPRMSPSSSPRPGPPRVAVSSSPHEAPPRDITTGKPKSVHPRHAIYEYKASEFVDRTNSTIFVNEPLYVNDYGNIAFNWTHSAPVCVEKHKISPSAYMAHSNTTVRIVWFIWLPSNGHSRNIVLGQLWHLLGPNNDGLLFRPNTKLYITLFTESIAEEHWFYSLPFFRPDADWNDPNGDLDSEFTTNPHILNQDPSKPMLSANRRRPVDISIFQTNDNAYEFWGIRWLWELGCEFPDDIYLYFHTKGARYGALSPKHVGYRLKTEYILTRQHLRPWRSIISLLAATDQPSISWTGGKQYHWYNFLWMKGEFMQRLLKPVKTHDRFWYELWNGKRTNQSYCDGSHGLSHAVSEEYVNTDVKPYFPGPDALWQWYPHAFYGMKECRETPGDGGYAIVSVKELKWVPSTCNHTNGLPHDFCLENEIGAPPK